MRIARAWRCSKWLHEKSQITPTLQNVPNVSIISRKKTEIWGPPTYGNGKVRKICRTFLYEEKKASPQMKQPLLVTSGLFPCLWCSTHSKAPVEPTPFFSIQECHAIDPHNENYHQTPIDSDGPDSKDTADRTGESSPRQSSDYGSLCSPLKPSLDTPFLLSSHA